MTTMAEAAAVNDGKIVFVGTLEDVKEYAGPLTIVHDYGENVISRFYDRLLFQNRACR